MPTPIPFTERARRTLPALDATVAPAVALQALRISAELLGWVFHLLEQQAASEASRQAVLALQAAQEAMDEALFWQRRAAHEAVSQAPTTD
jgi:hypothetical protein